MRLSTVEQLLQRLDEVVAAHERGDRTSRESEHFWEKVLTIPNHPLNTNLPDEPLVDWYERGLLGDLHEAPVLDVGCGNGRNSAWLASKGAKVTGIDIATELLEVVRPRMPEGVTLLPVDVLREELPGDAFDLVYDSGCFHHLAPHRRITYLEQVMPRVARAGKYGIVAFAQERQPSPSDTEILITGDTAGGTSFTLTDLETIFSPYLKLDEARPVAAGISETFGADFLNAALFTQRKQGRSGIGQASDPRQYRTSAPSPASAYAGESTAHRLGGKESSDDHHRREGGGPWTLSRAG